MIRNLALIVAISLPYCLATASHAQTAGYDAGGPESPYGVSWANNQPHGGFGMEYTQVLASGSVVMDQYGLMHTTPYVPYVDAPPPVAAARPVAPRRPSRSTSNTNSNTNRAAASSRASAQRRYQLPIGSLGANSANGASLYTPQARSQSYGNSYGYGPYGVSDYSGMWHGFATR